MVQAAGAKRKEHTACYCVTIMSILTSKETFTQMFGLGTEELVVILVIVLVLFGGKKLPELSRAVGQSFREIRKGINGEPETPTNATPKNNPES